MILGSYLSQTLSHLWSVEGCTASKKDCDHDTRLGLALLLKASMWDVTEA